MPNLDLLLLKGPSSGNIAQSLDDLRYTILTTGVPANSDGMSELRIYIWLILLNAPPIRTEIYLDLVRQGASPAYAKIRNDTFRTLATDPLFRRRVTENSLTRVLNAVAWKLHDAHEACVNGWMSPPTLSMHNGDFGGSPDVSLRSRSSLAGTVTEGSEAGTGAHETMVGYVQGMNVLAAPFLYAARSETEAFVAFERFITREVPGYLSKHLLGKGMKAEIYAFASVLTMCACTPPLPEVLLLWDFLLAYGSHLNILCIVAQLVLIRDQILGSPSPNQVLRQLPPLQASKVSAIALTFVPKIPEDVYEQIVNHAK
ncbi:CDC16 protein [Coniosporium tulheliwenetii]|uniref:CDC16 protein n=1 Tax=Coniosporium tulheliwenetii TaxID=3383036 RepID=A0ACC2ZM05_9PEZI|nr:CDC16 protein [Cladosporium sp. JES 115]